MLAPSGQGAGFSCLVSRAEGQAVSPAYRLPLAPPAGQAEAWLVEMLPESKGQVKS